MDRKNVLVTGSSRGIGKSIIIEFAKKGYDVIINYNKSEAEALALKKDIEKKYGVKAMTIKCDISDEKEVVKMIDDIIFEFGKIDVLINNAAIENTSNFFDKNKETFMEVLSTNLIGTFLVSRSVSEYMLKAKKGRIINISSNNSINKFDGTTVEYDTSKAGVNILTKIMAQELSPFINVNGVAPGWVLTDDNKKLDQELNGCFVKSESDKIYLKRFAKPEEIASVVLFLASDEASYINGEIIIVDGGSYSG